MGRTVQTNLKLKTKRYDPNITRRTIFGDVMKGGWGKPLPTTVKCKIVRTYENGDTMIFCDKAIQPNHGYGPTLPCRAFILTRKGKLAVPAVDVLVGDIRQADVNYVALEVQNAEKRKDFFIFPSEFRQIDAHLEIN